MKFTLLDLYSFSIIIAAITGWVRFKKINPAFYPFLIFVWLGFLNEVLSYFLIYSGHSNAININIYVLAESLLLVWQFQQWQVPGKRLLLYKALMVALFLAWLTEILFTSAFTQTITYFRVLYSFIIVILSIPLLNRQLLLERANVLKNAVFLICVAFIIYFTFTVVTGIFWMYGFGGSKAFRRSMVWILIYINVFANLIYALAVLWMPKKLRFSLPY